MNRRRLAVLLAIILGAAACDRVIDLSRRTTDAGPSAGEGGVPNDGDPGDGDTGVDDGGGGPDAGVDA